MEMLAQEQLQVSEQSIALPVILGEPAFHSQLQQKREFRALCLILAGFRRIRGSYVSAPNSRYSPRRNRKLEARLNASIES